jgi:hypothetical protein
LNKDIKRHIGVWAIASVVGYLSCVALFVARWYMPHELLTKPFFFLTEKIIASVVGISFLTGVTIYAGVAINVPILKKLAENPIALALYVSMQLYVVGWIWTYS